MKHWTEDELRAEGYIVENAKITSVNLTMDDHGCLDFPIVIEGQGFGLIYGGYCLGKGYVGSDDFEGSAAGEEAIMRIMDTVGVDKASNLKGSYVRIARNKDGYVRIIGNIINDKWFDYESFFEDKKNEN